MISSYEVEIHDFDHILKGQTMENQILDGLLRPMTVISTQAVSSIYGESP